MDIYSLLYEPIKLKTPIRMFEAFAGIGTQSMALKRITSDYEIVGYSEIDKYAIQSYKAIHGKHIKNYGDICKMTEIPPCDIFTWSFPCTDLSKAGKQAGMSEDTRSGLIYEVVRLLKDTKIKPKVLIMENVIDLIQTKFIREFHEIQNEIEALGYQNYVEVLNAKNYGVAQNRERVFMVSVLGDYSYEFPGWIKLEKRLKDYLEDEVDEKYYLSDKQLEEISNPKYESMGIDRVNEIDGVYNVITTIHGGNREPKVFTIGNVNPSGNGMNGKVYAGDLAPTITTNKGEGVKIAIPIEPSIIQLARGYNDGGIIGDICPSITTSSFEHNNYVVLVANEMKKYPNRGIYWNNGIAYWIRKLLSLECWRLMGISDDDYYKAQAVCSNSQLYKQAGNAIVVDVFEAILRKLVDYEN